MKFSKFADKFISQSGIGLLMDDLADALQPGQKAYMLGGGNPAHIPAVEKCFRESMQHLMARNDAFEQTVGSYAPPQGDTEFLDALAALMHEQFGWKITRRNIALTHGSQQAFFVLFNMFAGPYSDGSQKKILFPLAPEYIGYSDVGLGPDLFCSLLPSIQMQDEIFFKYRINFDALDIADDIGAICVSRPTNPSGNVVTDEEVAKLAQIAHDRQIPLIIDNAYGRPFPDIIFTDAAPYRDENTIVCMSLSKLGLPGTRTGIVIAPEDVIDRISRMNAVLTLAPGGMGTAIATEIVRSGRILTLSRDIIRPFYQEKLNFALQCAKQSFSGFDWAVHKPEGSFFLWAWFKGLPIPCDELYRRLKNRGVIVVPGHYFFFGLDRPHPHQHQCLRINYSQPPEVIEPAFNIIGEEIRKLY